MREGRGGCGVLGRGGRGAGEEEWGWGGEGRILGADGFFSIFFGFAECGFWTLGKPAFLPSVFL